MSTLQSLNNIRTQFPLDKLYSAEPIPGTERAGYSPVYRNSASPTELIPSIAGLTTLHQLFQNAVDLFGEDDCLGARLTKDGKLDDYYTYQTYNEIDKRRLHFASGLIQTVNAIEGFPKSQYLDQDTGKPNFIVTVSGQNCIEMLLVDLSTRSFSLPNCGLYDSLSDFNCNHILSVTNSPVLVLNKFLIGKFINIKQKFKLNSLICFICFEDLGDGDEDRLLIENSKTQGIKLVDFKHVEKLGKDHTLPHDFNLPTPETLYTLAFTSGTTGLPKGVYLTHSVATANVTGFFIHVPKPAINLTQEQMKDFTYNKDSKGRQLRTQCFLPLLHNYEKSISNFELSYGIALALPSKPGTQSLFEDLEIIKPSLFNGVPRIFTLVENRIKSELAKFSESDPSRNEKVKKMMGFENISFLQCASAPISKESILFLKSVLTCGFLNSYGATELFSVISYSDPYQTIAGSSGPVAVNSELKLKDVSEMGYSSTDTPYPRGEVLIRGHSQFSHYFQNEKATKDSIDEEGWYHTGDVASLDAKGNLFIIDRVKNFFKLSQGEYITPEKIETVYLSKNPILTQLFVHGDPYENYLIGIAGVDLQNVKTHLANDLKSEFIRDLSDEDLLKFINLSRIKKFILAHLLKNVNGSGLQGFEKLHNVHFETSPLSIENETLTPSFKLKRNTAKVVHSEKIKNLYKEGSLMKQNKL
jgi:long-chain acyl-CoA synthetase